MTDPTTWTCSRCHQPITDDPHTDPNTGDDVHDQCCTRCHPALDAIAQETP